MPFYKYFVYLSYISLDCLNGYKNLTLRNLTTDSESNEIPYEKCYQITIIIFIIMIISDEIWIIVIMLTSFPVIQKITNEKIKK